MLTIHGIPLSVHTRKVVLAAILKGLDYRLEPVIPFDPPPGWDDLSPTGLIPVIEDDGFVLADSTAICLYLEAKAPGTAPLLPSEPQALGRVLALDGYAADTLFRTAVQGLFVNRVIRPRILNQACDEAAVRAILAEAIPRAFGHLEAQLAAGVVGGARLGLADLAVASNLINYLYLGFTIDAGRHPRLAAYVERLLDEPAVRTALAAEAPFAEQMGLDRGFVTELAAA